MKRFIQIVVLILTSTLFFLSFKVSSVSAQGCTKLCSPQGNCDGGYHCDEYGICVNDLTCPSCIGNTGKHGACQQTQDCPSGWDDGFGDCVSVPYQYYECCAEPTPTPTIPFGTCKCSPDCYPIREYCGSIPYPQCQPDQFGRCQEDDCICIWPTLIPTQPPTTPQPTPKLKCGDECQNSNECDQSPPPLVCDPNYNLCESPITCPICLGTISGKPGVCLDPDVCENMGKNRNDGVGTCYDPINPQEVCCTNYDNVPSCQLFPIPPFYLLIDFTVNITSPLPNISYAISGGPNCFCSSPTFTDPYHGSFRCACSPMGLYTITAHSPNHAITCSTEVNVSQPNPYPPCTGHFTKQPGECHYFNCPIGTTWDGMNPPFTDTGCDELGYACCVYGNLSDQIPRPALVVECERNGNPGINTAIGCIPITSQTNFLAFILPWALGVGGGTAFVVIVVGGFLYMTSGGNPQRVKAAKELITSAIIGLLLIIFSVYILDLIGIRILRIPGL